MQTHGCGQWLSSRKKEYIYIYIYISELENGMGDTPQNMAYTHSHMHTRTHIYTHTRTHTYTLTHTRTLTHSYNHTQIYVHTELENDTGDTPQKMAGMMASDAVKICLFHSTLHTHIHPVYIHTCIRSLVRTYVYACMHARACMHACIYHTDKQTHTYANKSWLLIP